MAAVKKPATKRTTKKAAAAKAPEQEQEPASQASIRVGPTLVAKHQLDITAEGLPPGAEVTIHIEPEGTSTGTTQMTASPYGTVQTAIYPVAGPHRVSVEGKGVKAVLEFDVAES